MNEDQEKVKVLTLLMLLQASVYAADECEGVEWFYVKRTKQVLKTAVDIILREHGPAIKALWNEEGVQMPEVTRALEEFTQLIGTTEYFNLPHASALLRAYQAGEFDEAFNPKKDEQQLTSRGSE